MNITNLKPFSSVLPPGQGKTEAPATQKQAQAFGDFLKEALHKVNTMQLDAEKMAADFTVGKDVQLHEVIIATEKATLALQLTMQIRNKAIDAYQEIMRMQI